ncbi:MAG: glycyl-radical enzyme activating protein [Blautia sp.]|jgi:pyruvate formate lyase activating enzyme
MKKGFIYSIQRYCIHDGPGIRTDVFFKGCQLACPWCSNPESQHEQRELSFAAHKCVHCGLCVEKCPSHALDLQRSTRIDPDKCDLCGICVRYCPRECYQMFGREVTVEELLTEVEKDLPFYQNTGGGVTVTGGEPTLQWEFLVEFLKACKEKGLDTAMETHVHVSPQVLRQLAPYVDHFLTDVKHMDSVVHQQVIGVGNGQILDNIRMLSGELGKEVSLRIPCIPGFNQGAKNKAALKDFAQEIKETGNLKMIHLLPYHNLAMGKYESLRRKYPMGKEPVMDEEILREYEAELLQAGLPVIIGG